VRQKHCCVPEKKKKRGPRGGKGQKKSWRSPERGKIPIKEIIPEKRGWAVRDWLLEKGSEKRKERGLMRWRYGQKGFPPRFGGGVFGGLNKKIKNIKCLVYLCPGGEPKKKRSLVFAQPGEKPEPGKKKKKNVPSLGGGGGGEKTPSMRRVKKKSD